LGGKVTIDKNSSDKPVIRVGYHGLTKSLVKSKITDAELVYLKDLTKLQCLDLRGTSVTDAELEYLKGLTSLQTLNLSDTKVTDAGLEHLKGLTELQKVWLRFT
jgi:Leucine-rich repeat (LRR) protein